MSMSRFRFNIVSIIEVVVIVILVPMSISIWKKAWSNMVYHQNFKQSLGYYSVEKWTEMEQALTLSEASRPDDTPTLYFKANFLLEKKKIKQAREIYQSIVSQGYIDILPARIGLIICKLYETEEEKEQKKLFHIWNDLERDLLSLIKEDKSFADAQVLLGHIYYKKGLWLQKEKDNKKSKAFMDKAWQTFIAVENQTGEVASLWEKCDINEDNLVSKNEWKGTQEQWMQADVNGDGIVDRKELAFLWNPPSRGACQSLYVGKALVSLWRGQELWQQIANTSSSEEAKTAVSEICIALENIKKTIAYRVINPEIPVAICSLYKKLLASPFVSEDIRRELIQEALHYNQDIHLYCTHLNGFRQNYKIEEGKLKENLSDMYLGIAISYYYLGSQSDSWLYFDRSLAGKKDNQRSLYQDSKMHSLVGFMDKEYNQRKRMEVYNNGTVYHYYQKAFLDLPKEGTLSNQDFIILNNYIAMHYLKGRLERVPNYCKEANELLEKALSQLPDSKFYAGVQEDPVSARQIATHNLYIMLKNDNAKRASTLKQHKLTRTK